MTVAWIGLFSVKPGRLQEFLSDVAEAKKIFDRHGAKNFRVFTAAIAGPNSNMVTAVSEYPSHEAWGKIYEALQADPAFQALFEKLMGPDSTSTFVSTSLLTELPV